MMIIIIITSDFETKLSVHCVYLFISNVEYTFEQNSQIFLAMPIKIPVEYSFSSGAANSLQKARDHRVCSTHTKFKVV